MALVGLVALAGSLAVGAWFLGRRPTDAAPAPVASPEPSRAVVAEPTRAATSLESARRAMAEAPVLNEESAGAFLAEMARRGQDPAPELDNALFVASTGFLDLDRPTLGELGGLFARSWSGRSASEGSLIQSYMRHAREGEVQSPEAIAAGRTLFAQGVLALPAASRERLRALFAEAVRAGIAHRQRAEERAQTASLTPLPSAEMPPPEPARNPRPSVEATAEADGRRAEAAKDVSPEASDWDLLKAKNEGWRERYRAAKAVVDRLQAEVAKLEEDAKNNFVAGQATEWIAGQLVVKNPDPRSPYKSYAERIQERLPAARRELADAKQALAAVEEGARKDGVASGQLY